ncbi:sensor histidine kinase [Euzebya tangerina]|uniref:sensor histidine kinase n=1 Tax=Euzebya tangerina TaxID=591198 RepID=UPI000E31EC60|nr:HAMP domain-containing sensor histidine kinase [Euzebya tangerina]
MGAPRSLRGRVALVACLVVGLGFLLTGAALQGAAARQARERFDDELRDRLSAVLDEAWTTARPDLDGGPPAGPRPFGLGPAGLPDIDDERLQPLRDVADRTLGRGFFLSLSFRDRILATLGDEPASGPPGGSDGTIADFVDEDGRRWRVLTHELPGGRVAVQLGGDVQAFVNETVQGFRRLVVVLGSIATLATGLATAWAVGRATRPMSQLVEATQTVAATQDLSRRVTPESAPLEIREVADSLNAMLERLEQAAEAQATALHGARRFAADAGHELRTPLTAMQTTLDSLVRNPDAPEEVRREGLVEVAGETRRLSELLASLQLLARIDAGAGEAPQAVDLLEIVEDAATAARERWTDLLEPPELRVNTGAADQVVVTGLGPWLRSVVDNLLTNAAVHGRPGGVIDVHVQQRDRVVHLLVDDDGPGIPPADRAAVFHRFHRGADADDRPGHGLGLSLVAQLVALHGGTVEVEDAPLGGARMHVQLPLQ